jgi:hypothetical protein
MVAVEVTRLVGQVIRAATDKAGATRQTLEVGGQRTHTTSEAVQATRVTGQTLRETTPAAGVTRQSLEVGATGGHTSSEVVQASRLVGQVLFGPEAEVAVTRQTLEVGATRDHASAQDVLATRLTGQVIGRVSALPVVPLDMEFPDDTDFFVHNWVSKLTMDTIFRTDVVTSTLTAAEERTVLLPRPYRTLRLAWTREGQEELDRLLVTLRRFTHHRMPIPLYQDETPLLQDIDALDTTIYFDTTDGRFFQGGRIAIVELDHNHLPTGTVYYRRMQQVFGNRAVIDSELNVDVDLTSYGGWSVFPMMDCETLRKPRWRLRTDGIFEVKLEMREVYGASSLPPWDADIPAGFEEHDDYPIFNLEPDWVKTPKAGLHHPGEDFSLGLSRVVYNIGDRPRTTADYFLRMDRDDAKSYIKFMESRLGRARPFWEVDQETIWDVIGFSPTGDFIDFSTIGQFDDLEVPNWTQVGLIYEDTVYVRDVVSVQDLNAIWRVTVDPQLPTTLTMDGLLRFSRAHLVRNQKDSIRETWISTNVMETKYRTLEVLEEGDAEF